CLDADAVLCALRSGRDASIGLVMPHDVMRADEETLAWAGEIECGPIALERLRRDREPRQTDSTGSRINPEFPAGVVALHAIAGCVQARPIGEHCGIGADQGAILDRTAATDDDVVRPGLGAAA